MRYLYVIDDGVLGTKCKIVDFNIIVGFVFIIFRERMYFDTILTMMISFFANFECGREQIEKEG